MLCSKKKWICGIFLVIIVIVAVIMAQPRDVVDAEHEDITVILAEFNAGYPSVNVESVDLSDHAEEIIDILSAYKERTEFAVAGGYNLGKVEFRIVIQADDDVKEILLGEENYSYLGRGKFKYTIINADELKKELRNLAE